MCVSGLTEVPAYPCDFMYIIVTYGSGFWAIALTAKYPSTQHPVAPSRSYHLLCYQYAPLSAKYLLAPNPRLVQLGTSPILVILCTHARYAHTMSAKYPSQQTLHHHEVIAA